MKYIIEIKQNGYFATLCYENFPRQDKEVKNEKLLELWKGNLWIRSTNLEMIRISFNETEYLIMEQRIRKSWPSFIYSRFEFQNIKNVREELWDNAYSHNKNWKMIAFLPTNSKFSSHFQTIISLIKNINDRIEN